MSQLNLQLLEILEFVQRRGHLLELQPRRFQFPPQLLCVLDVARFRSNFSEVFYQIGIRLRFVVFACRTAVLRIRRRHRLSIVQGGLQLLRCGQDLSGVHRLDGLFRLLIFLPKEYVFIFL